MSRLIFASTVAAIAVFLWGFISHVVSPLGEAGVTSLPNESALLDLMRANIPEKGLYFFPGVGDIDNLTEDQQRAWADKIKAGPNGLLLFDPAGHAPLSAQQLITELISDFLAAFLLGILLGYTSLSLWGRVAFGAGVGLVGWLSISVGYWNWYQFPTTYILAQGFDLVTAWALAALVLSLVLRRASKLASSTDA
ncbi:MAG TPA: hypothetical protein VEZ88_06175 [Steroidobacteraceae bacterium]|nr:hypothetical protein [Steroidobacteraceae bacterium]